MCTLMRGLLAQRPAAFRWLFAAAALSSGAVDGVGATAAGGGGGKGLAGAASSAMIAAHGSLFGGGPTPSARSATMLSIRPATAADVPAMKGINEAVLPENYQSAFYRAQLADWPGLQLVACAPADGQVVGYCLGKMEAPRAGHITSIAVLPAHRNGGAATAIMREVTVRMRQRYGATSVSLNVRLSNAAARHVYAMKLGYVTDAVYSRYYADGEDALHLVLALSDEAHGVARVAVPRGGAADDADDAPADPARSEWL